MTRSHTALCALLLALAAPAGAITADELAAKNIEARGGAAALDAVQNVRRSGRLVAGGGQRVYGVVETRRRPDSIREDLSLQGLTQVQSYDGKEGWKIDPFGGRKDPERVPADDLKGLIENAAIGGPLAGCRERGDTLEYLGTEDIDGTVAHKLKARLEGRRPALPVPRPRPFPRDPHREPAHRARREAHDRHGPRRVREGRGRLLAARADVRPQGQTATRPRSSTRRSR